MERTLKGLTALVTGAPLRVGRRIALGLASEGVNVVVHHRGSGPEAHKLGSELEALGVRSWLLEADFSKASERDSLVARAREAAGRLDILVNNASSFEPATLDDITFPNLVEQVEVNAWAPFTFCRDFARLAGKGKIVNILDSRITGFDWRHVGYILSKDMLATLTRMLALRLAPDILVNAVAPGLILPPAGRDEAYLQSLAWKIPLKRHGGPEDVAAAVLYLLRNDYLTGQVIFVDGGRSLMELENGPDAVHPAARDRDQR